MLKLANRMFVEKTAGLKGDFQRDAEKYFRSPAEALDFRSSYEKSREQINSWVEKQTNNKITGLLQPGMLHTKIILLQLLNTILVHTFSSTQINEVKTGVTFLIQCSH